ncbi:hypothetical protein D3C79_571240 [compost metagenome]
MAQGERQQIGPGGRAIHGDLQRLQICSHLAQLARRQLQLLFKLGAILFDAFNGVQQFERARQILLGELIDRRQRLLLIQSIKLILNVAARRHIAVRRRMGNRLADRTSGDQ